MRPICHPLYSYTPWSEKRRAEASANGRARWGVADGYRRVCGVDFPEDVAARVEPFLRRIAAYPGSLELAREAALQFLERGPWALRPYMRDTPQWVRARIRRRRARLVIKQQAEETAMRQLMRRLTQMEAAERRKAERLLIAEERQMEVERGIRC